jgi:hypothetical protein
MKPVILLVCLVTEMPPFSVMDPIFSKSGFKRKQEEGREGMPK